MIQFLKRQWPAIIASIGFGALMMIAVELVINNWEWVRGTLR